MKNMVYDQTITQEDFDFMKKSNDPMKKESLLLDYLGILLSIAFIVFLCNHVKIDINLSFDNLLKPHSFIVKHKLY